MAHLGSFAAPLAIPEALRPWAQSGLAALYAPGGLQLPEAQAAEHAVDQAAGRAEGQGASSGVAAGAASGQHVRPASTTGDAPRWPEPWRALAGRVRTAPRVIITYADLAVDLSGTPHPGRRKLFRDILGYLAWPQGATLFWPLCSLKDGKACPAPEVFALGVRHFGVRHLACFGPDAAGFARGHIADEEGGPSILELPAPLELVDLLPHELHIAVKALKTLVIE